MAKREYTKVEYGSVVMFRSKCPNCGEASLISNGLTLCCDEPIKKPKKYKTKRECIGSAKKRIKPKQKREIIEQQNNKCIYCGIDLDDYYYYEPKIRNFKKVKTHFDHFIPWKYSLDNSTENCVASCSVCNLIKSDKIFDTLEEAKDFINLKKNGTQI